MEGQKHSTDRKGILYLCIAATAIGMQLLYHYGTLEHLLFMLWPVAFVVEKALGISFYYHSGVGFLSEEVHVIINKTCAGTTFWTMAFCMLSFSFIPRVRGMWKRATWFFTFIVIAYMITLLANISRIIIAIGMLNLKISENASVERLLHQSVGVLVYCTYLWVIYLVFSQLIRKEENYEKAL